MLLQWYQEILSNRPYIEVLQLQCMDDLKEYPDTIAKAFKAFGNAVNVRVVNKIAEQLLRDYETD